MPSQTLIDKITGFHQTENGRTPVATIVIHLFWLCVALQLLIMPLILFPNLPTGNPAVHSKEFAAQILMLLTALVAVAAFPFRNTNRTWNVPDTALVIFLGIQCLSAAMSAGRFSYCFGEGWLYAFYTALAFYMSRIPLTTKTAALLAGSVMTGATACCLYGLSVFFGWNPLETYFPFVVDAQGRSAVYSFMGNPEFLGTYLAPVAVLSLGWSVIRLKAERPVSAVFLLVLTLLFLLTILLTGTRGALIGWAFGSLVMLLPYYHTLQHKAKSRLRIAGIILVILFAAVFTVFSFPNRFNTRSLKLADRFVELFNPTSASVKERVFFYTVSGQMICQSPVLGAGPGTFKLNFYPAAEQIVARDDTPAMYNMMLHIKARVAEHAHNDYLEFWTELGTLGLSAFLLILALITHGYIKLFRYLRSDTSGVAQWLTILAGTLLAVYAIAMFSFPFHMPVRAGFVWIMIGLYFALYRYCALENDNSAQTQRQ